MSQHDKDTAFFRTLLSRLGESQCHTLRNRINENQRNERAVCRAVFLACLLGLTSLAGLGYSALFHPEILQDSSHALFRTFAITGIASLICLTAFVLHWFHYRNVSNHLHDECRRFLLGAWPTGESAPSAARPFPRVASQDSPLPYSQTPRRNHSPKLIPLPRAS